VSKVFDAVPDMPPCYDASALVDELARMNLFAIEMRDFVAALACGVRKREAGGGRERRLAARVAGKFVKVACVPRACHRPVPLGHPVGHR
jgi:hypothetical protein